MDLGSCYTPMLVLLMYVHTILQSSELHCFALFPHYAVAGVESHGILGKGSQRIQQEALFSCGGVQECCGCKLVGDGYAVEQDRPIWKAWGRPSEDGTRGGDICDADICWRRGS